MIPPKYEHFNTKDEYPNNILQYPFESYNNINNNQRIFVKKNIIILYGVRSIKNINKDLIYNNINESK